MTLISYFNAILIVFYQYFTILSTINKEIIIIIILIIIMITIIIIIIIIKHDKYELKQTSELKVKLNKKTKYSTTSKPKTKKSKKLES